MPVRTGITAYAEGLTSMARECRLDWVKTCSYLVEHFTILFHCARIFEKYNGIVELRLIFVRLVSFNFKLRINAV